MRKAICNINIEIPIPEKATDEEIQHIIQEYELPEEYVPDSLEFQKVLKE